MAVILFPDKFLIEFLKISTSWTTVFLSSSLKLILIFSFVPFFLISVSILSTRKKAKFHCELVSAVPLSIVISENHAIPLQLSSYPPSLNPIFISSLSLESINSCISCQSLVPTIDFDFSVVSKTAMLAPAF